MHHVYQSNHSDSLFVMMQAVIHEEQLQQNPLKPLTIIVPSQGMAQWLKQCFAKSQQIAANIDCILPSEWLWRSYRNILEQEIPKNLPFDKNPLIWRLLKVFIEDKTIHQNIPYPIDTDSEAGLYKSYQFAETLADLFDQYLVYRQPLLRQWEKGQTDIHFPWQSQLWQRLIETYASTAFLHTGQCHSQFIAALNNQKQLEDNQMIFFGFASYEPNLISAIEALSIKHQVHSFVLMPCQEFWLDQNKANRIDEDVHSLLASWGKLGRDFSNYLIEQSHQTPELFDSHIKAFSGNASHSLLAQLQNGIRELDNAAIKVEANDFSLSLHRCYGPLREMQVLHDQILHLLNQEEQIEPSDICVMLTDVNRYKPYIESVFQQNTEHQLSYTLSDANPLQEEPIIQHFFELLQLPNLPLTNETLLNWLETEAFTDAFNLNIEDIETIKSWLNSTEIRWGLDEKHQEELNSPIQQNSWEFGLNRLITGYFMSENHQEPVIYQQQLAASIDSYDSHAQTIQRFWQLTQTLKQFRQQLKGSKTIQNWHHCLKQLIESCFKTNDSEQFIINQLHQSVDGLLEMSESTEFSHALNIDIINHHLKQSLNQKQRLVRFLRGGINFVSLQPLRAIPFKAIFILGLNQNDYPRKNERLSFDLLAKNSQLGDRSPSEEDKYLFLEALMSAQIKLGLFWQGWDLSNNSELFPSPLVTELETFITDIAGKEALEAISFVHSLHANDAENYLVLDSTKPLTQSFKQLPELQQVMDDFSTEIDSNFDANELTIDSLIQFFRDPIRQFLKRLNIDFRESSLAETTEPFTNSKYQQRDLNNAIIEQLSQKEHRQTSLDWLKLSGQFPYNFDELQDNAKVQLADYAALLEQQFQQPEEQDISIHLPISNIKLSGIVTSYNQQIVMPCYEDIEKKDIATKAASLLVPMWLNWLLLSVEQASSASLFGFDKQYQPYEYKLEPIAKQQAIEQLDSIVQLYKQSFKAPIPFDNYYSNKAMDAAKAFDDINSPDAQEKAMRAQNFGESSFYNQQLLFEHGIENHPDFLSTANTFWGNFFRWLN